jgi:hypothetical protein
MALRTPATLGQIIDEVLRQSGDGLGSSLETRDQLASFVRRAHRWIEENANHMIAKTQTEATLASGATSLAWPDRVDPGSIVAIEAADGRQIWTIEYGIDARMRDAALISSNQCNRPWAWDGNQDGIEFIPGPAEELTLTIRHRQASPPLTEEAEFTTLPDQPLILLTLINYLSMDASRSGALAEMKSQFQAIVDSSARAANPSGGCFRIGQSFHTSLDVSMRKQPWRGRYRW